MHNLNLALAATNERFAGINEWKGQTRDGLHWEVHRGDSLEVLKTFRSNRFASVITSPPYYWQRDYKVAGQLGMETSIAGYVNDVASVMDEVRRVLTSDGLLFLNLGDTYYSAKGQPVGDDKKNSARRFGLRAVDASGLGVPRKTTIGIPWRVALEMVERGWTLRSPIVWHRPGSMPEPTAKDRPWRTYEMLFMFSKSPRYYFDRARLGDEEDVWNITERRRSNGIHFATFPDQLVERCLDIGCKPGGEVLDPFAGAGTALRVALGKGHPASGIDLNEKYCHYAVKELLEI
jgi:DNA modification methylase